MNEEWCCASTAIDQIMIARIISIYDELKTQIWQFVKVASWTKWPTLDDKIELRISGQTEKLCTLNAK